MSESEAVMPKSGCVRRVYDNRKVLSLCLSKSWTHEECEKDCAYEQERITREVPPREKNFVHTF